MSIFRTTLIDEDSQRSLFEEMYLNYRKQMLLVARSVLRSDTDAEDVVHDVFLKIAQKHMSKISKVENTIDLRNYLLKATKHTALDHLRKRLHEKPFITKYMRTLRIIPLKGQTTLLLTKYATALSVKGL